MGYLNNSVVTIDAILTKKGRERLAQGDGTFQIIQYALGDDEIDYTMYNPNHPSGSAFYGEAIENMPLLEAFPDETQIMKYKLTTLPRGTIVIPYITSIGASYSLIQSDVQTITPTTSKGNGQQENELYNFTISDIRMFSTVSLISAPASKPSNIDVNTTIANTLGTNVSATYQGSGIVLTATSLNSLFGSSNTIYGTIIVEGLSTGARLQVPINITKSN